MGPNDETAWDGGNEDENQHVIRRTGLGVAVDPNFNNSWGDQEEPSKTPSPRPVDLALADAVVQKCPDCSFQTSNSETYRSHAARCADERKRFSDESKAGGKIDEQALARNIAQPIISEMKQGFEMLAQVLMGQKPQGVPAPLVKRPRGRPRKDKNVPSARIVPRAVASGGSESVGPLESSSSEMADS